MRGIEIIVRNSDVFLPSMSVRRSGERLTTKHNNNEKEKEKLRRKKNHGEKKRLLFRTLRLYVKKGISYIIHH